MTTVVVEGDAGRGILRQLIDLHLRQFQQDALSPLAAANDQYIPGCGVFECRLHDWGVAGTAEAVSYLMNNGHGGRPWRFGRRLCLVPGPLFLDRGC